MIENSVVPDKTPHAPSTRTRVFFVIRNLGKGGAEKVMSVLLEKLDRDRIEPICIFYDADHVYAVPKDVTVHCLGIPGSNRYPEKFLRTFLRVFKLGRLIDSEKPDVIFSFLNGVNLTAISAAMLSGRKARLVISERNTHSRHERDRSGGIERFLIMKLYPRADRIVAVSNGVKADLVRNYRLPEEKVSVIYNPIDAARIETLSKEEVVEHPWFGGNVPIIISVGSLTQQKGQAYLLKAFKEIRAKCAARLVVLGEGPMENDLRLLAADLGIHEDVAFLGFRENPYKFISRSSVFALSSLWEGLPNVLLEAMACGVPVVSTDCPSGPNEIIQNEVNGLLVPVKDEKGLAEGILRILNDPERAGERARNAKTDLSKFSISRIVSEYERVITGVE